MSNKISSLIQTKKIGSPTKKAILMYMADKASDDGTGIWTSKANMANDLEMSDRAVRINIKEMLLMGVIVEAGQRKCSNGYTVDYSFNLSVVASLESTRTTPEAASPLNDVQVYPCTTFTPTPEPRSPKPSIEPPIEPSLLTKSLDNYNFDEFWKLYPKKHGKKPAQAKYLKAAKKHSHAKIMDGLKSYVKSDNVKKGFVMNATTWLNQERWEDEHSAPASNQSTNLQLEVLKELGLNYDA